MAQAEAVAQLDEMEIRFLLEPLPGIVGANGVEVVGAIPILRKLLRSPIPGKRSVHVEEKTIRRSVQTPRSRPSPASRRQLRLGGWPGNWGLWRTCSRGGGVKPTLPVRRRSSARAARAMRSLPASGGDWPVCRRSGIFCAKRRCSLPGSRLEYQATQCCCEELPVRMMCRCLKVSPSGFYGWQLQ